MADPTPGHHFDSLPKKWAVRQEQFYQNFEISVFKTNFHFSSPVPSSLFFNLSCFERNERKGLDWSSDEPEVFWVSGHRARALPWCSIFIKGVKSPLNWDFLFHKKELLHNKHLKKLCWLWIFLNDPLPVCFSFIFVFVKFSTENLKLVPSRIWTRIARVEGEDADPTTTAHNWLQLKARLLFFFNLKFSPGLEPSSLSSQ